METTERLTPRAGAAASPFSRPLNERQREFRFTERDFQVVRQRIYRRAGIALNPGKQEMVYSRLARRLRALGLNSFQDYLALLEDDDSPEWQAFVNAITTNLTHFFREPHHFLLLSQQLRRIGPSKPICVWSAGTATGEEAYSIAMTALETFPEQTPGITVLGSDVDTAVLAQAERGVYRLDRLESLSPLQLKRFFWCGRGPQKGFAKIRDEVKRLVSFRRVNLIEPDWGIGERLHAIFCRNVMIYFDRQTQYQILRKMHALMASEGRLYAGHSENFFHAKDLFQLCEKTVYRPLPR